MANFLRKLFPPAAGKPGLPAQYRGAPPAKPSPPPPAGAQLPNATIVYSIAASVLFVASGYSFLTGHWFNGVLVAILAVCLMGYAVYFLRNH